MSATSPPTSAVIPDALGAMSAQRLVIIDGSVDDDVLLLGEMMSLTEALAGEWSRLSGAIPVRWTPAEGLRTEDPEDEARIVSLLANANGSSNGGAGVNGGPNPLDRRDPLDIAAMLAQLFDQERERLLVIVEHAELVAAAGSDPFSRRNAAGLMQAVESFEGAAELHALVMLTRDPGWLPASVARRTAVASMHMPAPGVRERAAVVAQAFGGDPSSDVNERLAISTDGFALREVAMLPAHARSSGIGKDRPRELAAAFRHGYRTDPWLDLTPERMDKIEKEIRSYVFGQPNAVDEVLERLEVARSGLELDPPTSGARKSRLELFLVGPTGVGKNELARALARAIFGDAAAVMTFDMSAFQQEHSGEQLFGAPPGYVGHDNGSPLVDRLRERPFSVIVFDEIEKAHANNWLRLMAAIDEGRVSDTRHVQASLENAIVIFTSNIGGDVLLKRAKEQLMNPEQVAATTLGLVESHLSHSRYEAEGEWRAGLGKPEVWGRLSGSIVAFDLLRPEAVQRIVGRLCSTLAESARRAHEIDLEIDVPSISHAIEGELGMPGTWNGRHIKGYLYRIVVRPLAKALRSEAFASTSTIKISIDGGGRLVLDPG